MAGNHPVLHMLRFSAALPPKFPPMEQCDAARENRHVLSGTEVQGRGFTCCACAVNHEWALTEFRYKAVALPAVYALSSMSGP